MSYKLIFQPSALKEWNKLDSTIKAQFAKVLARRLENPRVPAARLHGGLYKIKLRDAGYRLVYEVRDDQLIVFVLAVGRRDKSEVYQVAFGRMRPSD
jgi:mRNA interferase RelE/StbE